MSDGQYVMVCGFNHEKMWHPEEVRYVVEDHRLTHCRTRDKKVWPILGLPVEGVRTTGNRIVDWSDVISFGEVWGG